MKKLYWLHFISALLIGLTACTTTNFSSAQQRDQYLQQFLGQSRQQIQRSFSLDHLGYQAARPTQSEPDRLIYHFVRPIPIPLSVTHYPIAGTGTVPIPLQGDRSISDQSLECQIIFELKQEIAISIRTQGRGC